ncbi:MAG: hypothetical protein LQ338_007498 [Usnochroma carphineum]|nr:MAG: hypothetical protein LQ338_007498 [Usnochroma carphineum]
MVYWIEAKLRGRITEGTFEDLVDEMADSKYQQFYQKYNDSSFTPKYSGRPGDNDLSTSHNKLMVPPNSTQELRAVIRLSGFSLKHDGSVALQSTTSAVEPNGDAKANVISNDKAQGLMNKIRDKQSKLRHKAKDLLSKPSDSQKQQKTSMFINGYLELGKACATVGWIGEARYHLTTACFMAERFVEEGTFTWCNAQAEYAKFLDRYGWSDSAFKTTSRLFDILSTRKLNDSRMMVLWEKVRGRLAAILLEQGNFSEGEKIYKEASHDFSSHDTTWARCLERTAWAQVRQEKYKEAYDNYLRLVDVPNLRTRRRTIQSNLGYIMNRLGDMEHAKLHFKRALSGPSETSQEEVERLCARSALFACLRKSDARPEDNDEISKVLVRHIDIISPLFQTIDSSFLIADCRFHFTITRQLELLLTTCSVPVTDGRGNHGVAFVDANPLDCRSQGRKTYFQFRFLTQCEKRFREVDKNKGPQWEVSGRIQQACQGHLIWVFQIAKFTPKNTWDDNYVDYGNSTDSDDPPDESTTRALQGAYYFSKLWLYFCTWKGDWKLVLNLLHLRLGDWLSYLRHTQHKDNLWVESQDPEILDPYDTISPNSGSIVVTCPKYQLSDFMMLWLAFRQLETLINSIEKSADFQMQSREQQPLEAQFRKVRETFDEFSRFCSIQKLRSNIIRTFTVSKQDKAGTTSPNKVETAPQDLRTSEPNHPIFAFQRTINEYVLEMAPYEYGTIEAATNGFFESTGNPKDQVSATWQETLNSHRKREISSLQNTRQVALTLFAAKSNYVFANSDERGIEDQCHDTLISALHDSGEVLHLEDSAGFWSYSHEVLSILMASLPPNHTPQEYQLSQPLGEPLPSRSLGSVFQRRMSVTVPTEVGTSTGFTQKNILESAFLPDWMYHHPEWFREQFLQIDIDGEISQLAPTEGLSTIIHKWRALRGSNTKILSSARFPYHVADAGKKKVADESDMSDQRQMRVRWFWNLKDVYNHLLEPRTTDHAKKRVIELASHDITTGLICWLTAPRLDKQPFLEFLRRHQSSESLFGERTDWIGNIWDTEFHIGFYQLLSKDDNHVFPPHLDNQGGFRGIIEVPKLWTMYDRTMSDRRDIRLVATSLRFVGDLRDRSWTCYSFSSVARYGGFTGILDEFTSDSTSNEAFFKEKMGQRRILEMTYVERILSEMWQSSKEIVDALDYKDPGDRDPRTESYDILYNRSRLHSQTQEILRQVLEQFNLALRAIEAWEEREYKRRYRSRWTEKDEERYSRRLMDLTLKCRLAIENLRMQKNHLEERQALAKQRKEDTISYMNVQEGHTSIKSAEDVRIFTLVTIIFLPLSFSSSLFSMQGAPNGNTIQAMVVTTVTALIVTIFVLSNMKLLDRHWSFRMHKFNVSAREKMKTDDLLAPWWNDKAKELDAAARLRPTDTDKLKRLPAESKWYYILFWCAYTITLPRLCMLRGIQIWDNRHDKPIKPLTVLVMLLSLVFLLPASTFLFLSQMILDIPELLWKAMHTLRNRMFHSPPNTTTDNLRRIFGFRIPFTSHNAEEANTERVEVRRWNILRNVSRKTFSTVSSTNSTLSNGIIQIFTWWLETRPIRSITRKLDFPPGKATNTRDRLPDPRLPDSPLLDGNEVLDEDDKWELAIEKSLAKDTETNSSSQQAHGRQRGTTEDVPAVGKHSWWTRLKNRERAESKV